MEEYIIIFNGESDFIRVLSKEQAEGEVVSLVKEGFSGDDMEVLKVIEKGISIDITEVGVKIDA